MPDLQLIPKSRSKRYAVALIIFLFAAFICVLAILRGMEMLAISALGSLTLIGSTYLGVETWRKSGNVEEQNIGD